MSASRYEPETVVVPQRAAPADRGPRQRTERDARPERTVRADDDERGDETEEPGYGHGV